MSTTRTTPLVSDAAERARALDPRESFLVQAPAGSGKTELLVLRYLALLPTVEEPEQVLAITFTRKATAEMRVRVLQALLSATSSENPAAKEHEREVRGLAKAALAHAEARGWQLIEQPQRLNIQTIDSLALSIAYQTPLLSRLGGQLSPTEEVLPLYALAAERTLAQLGNTVQPELADALAEILKLRDANLRDCESLIAGMLARRDQWLLVLPGIVRKDRPWEELQTTLEAPFQREHDLVVEGLRQEFSCSPGVVEELLNLGRIAFENGQDHLAGVRDLQRTEDVTGAAHWQCLCFLLLTNDNEWRSGIDARMGFPAKTHRAAGAQLKALIQRASANATLLNALRKVRKLPPSNYSKEEWDTVRNIFIVLRHAIAQLRVVFAEQDVIDFAEAGIAAHAALKNPSVLMRLDERIQHLLVDEFQDTSRPHFALLRAVLQDWQHGDGRTCFFVGDPMQSIYLFRNAESRLFRQVHEDGMEIGEAHLPMTALQLSTNFRSTPAIVNPINEVFERVLGVDVEDDVQYAPSVSSQGGAESGDNAMHLHVQLFEKDTRSRGGLDTAQLDKAEADAMVAVIRDHMPAIEQAQHDNKKFRVAILARARTHLVEIIAKLRREGIPFRGVKIDLLRDRQEILDLLSLLRALLHPSDRIAWLAVLRAPWCGLTIPALHAICGDAEDVDRDRSIPALIRLHADRLDPESRRRAFHTLSVLEEAEAAYASGSLAGSLAGLSLWLERTWHALGAPLFLNAESAANCEALFATLSQLPPSCFGTLDESLNQRLEELYAQPDPSASEDCGVQLMTIHAAKGLEFEVVLVPQLHRPGKVDDPPLFHWLVRRQHGATEDELLLAPIGYKHGDKPRLYDWVGKKSARRLRQEEKRLLYVACSRAIRELHLFAAVERKQDGNLGKPREGTLLAAGWNGLETRISEAARSTPICNLLAMPAASYLPAQHGIVETLAAGAHEPAQILHRLPADWFTNPTSETKPATGAAARVVSTAENMGSRLSRVQGIVLHGLLEHAAAGTGGEHPDWSRLTDALLRQHGLASTEAASARSAILQGIHNALGHEEGRWLLRAFAQGQQSRSEKSWSEKSWTSASEGRMLRQRPDRVFFGGESPGVPGNDYLWIVDYKTAALTDSTDRDSFLTSSREQYRSQLEAYSELFRKLSGLDKAAAHRVHRLAIYHPMLPWLDWWRPERSE
jgi:ATP-dependent exoDNAse (exonuclease V) beta subunit